MPTNRESAEASSKQRIVCAKRIAELTEVIPPLDLIASFCRAAKVRRMHQLKILFVLAAGACSEFVEPFAEVTRGNTAEPRKSVEEMVVTGNSRRRNESPHRESVHQTVVEALILERISRKDLSVSTGRSLMALAR